MQLSKLIFISLFQTNHSFLLNAFITPIQKNYNIHYRSFDTFLQTFKENLNYFFTTFPATLHNEMIIDRMETGLHQKDLILWNSIFSACDIDNDQSLDSVESAFCLNSITDNMNLYRDNRINLKTQAKDLFFESPYSSFLEINFDGNGLELFQQMDGTKSKKKYDYGRDVLKLNKFREADFYTNLIASKAIMYQYDKNKDGILTAREFHKPWRHFCTIFNRTYKDILRLWKKYESNYSISGEPLKDLDYREFRNGLDEKSLTLLISELVLVSVNDILRNAQQHGYASFVDELE